MGLGQNNLDLSAFGGKSVLITGGLGFIGSSLAIKLANAGANVTVVDAMLPSYGGNLFNIEPAKEKISVNYSNILDRDIMEILLKNKDYVFHTAGQVSHVLSYSDPSLDCDYNLKGTAILLDICSKINKDVKIIYIGTRGEYGKGIVLPASEEHPLNPLDVHEVTKLAAGNLLKAYERKYGIKSIWTRLTNIYGPRSQMHSDKYGVFNWFVRKAMDNEVIPIFGKGDMLRDYLYVDDCVDALLALALQENAYGDIFNIGHDEPTSVKEAIEKIIEVCGKGKVIFTEFSDERKNQEVQNWSTDSTKLQKLTGWKPATSLKDGIRKTIDYYTKFKRHYW